MNKFCSMLIYYQATTNICTINDGLMTMVIKKGEVQDKAKEDKVRVILLAVFKYKFSE
jgi:hypothetical protein